MRSRMKNEESGCKRSEGGRSKKKKKGRAGNAIEQGGRKGEEGWAKDI